MKKVLFSLFAIVLFNVFNLQAQKEPYIVKEKSFGGSDNEEARSIFLTQDGGYIIAGYSVSIDKDVHGNHGGQDIWIVKLDRRTDTLWTKCLGGNDWEDACDIKETPNGEYILVGETKSNNGDVYGNHGESDYWVVKLNHQGDTLWTKILGGSENDRPHAVQVTKDGGCIVVGGTESYDGDIYNNQGTSDYWIIKLNEQGDTTWTRTYGGSSIDVAYDVKQTEDGGYIVVGGSGSNDGDVHDHHNGDDYWVLRLDEQGDTLWTKSLGGASGEAAQSIIQTKDKGYVIAGYSMSNDGDVHGSHGDWDYWLAKLNEQGDTLWTKCLGGSDSDYAYSVLQTQDGGFIMTGFAASTNGDVHGNHGDQDYWVVKLDNLGDTLWTKCLGGSDNDYAYSVIEDKGYIVVGSSRSADGDITGTKGYHDFWFVKLKEADCLLGDYPFNDSTAYDESGNLNDGQLYGGLIAEGDRFGYENSSMYYEGDDNFIIIPHGANNIAEGAVSVWVHVENTTPDTFPVFTRPISGGGTDLELMINNGKAQFTLSNTTIESDITIPHDDWVHIVCVWNGSDMDMYINADPHGHDANTAGTADDSGVDMVLGNKDSWYAKGHIDDFQLFSCPLNPSEIDSLYHLENWAEDDNHYDDICIYSFYPFDGNANDVEKGNDGTVVGATPEIDRFNENGMALEFDGSGDSLVIPNGLNNMSNGSFSIWININDTSEYNPIFYKIKDDKKWVDLSVVHGKISFTLVDTNTLVSEEIIGNNEWHHIVGTWRDSLMTLFVDGKFQKYGLMTNGGIPDLSDCDLVLGKYIDTYLTGILDEFKIFDCPISQSDITEIYHDREWDIQDFKTECYNLNNNLTPEDFIIEGDSAKIEHERFMVYYNGSQDPSTLSRLGFMPDNIDSVIIAWDAPVNAVDSNFNFTGIAVEIGDTMIFVIHNQTKDYDQGMFLIENDDTEDQGPVFLAVDSTEINTGVYRNQLVFTNDNVYFTAYKLSDPSIVPFKMEYNPFLIDSNYTIKDINMIAFMQMANQSLSYNWMDNICIRLSEPVTNCEIVDYKFNDNLGDASSNAYHLTGRNGPILFKQNRFKQDDKAVYLADGQYAYTSNVHSVSGDFSLSTWVYPDVYAGNDTSLIFINDITSDNEAIMLGVFEATGKLFFGHIVNGDYQLQLSNISLPAQKWTHIVLNRDSIAKKYTLYINGEKANEFNYLTQALNSTTSLFVISTNDDPFQYKGRIDDLRLWRCQISSNQVDSLYHLYGWPKVMCQDMTMNITTTDASCGENNGKAQVVISNGSGDYSVEWSNGDKGLNADSLSSGSHSVQITDMLYGCMANRFFNINNLNAPSISIDKIDLTCYNEPTGSLNVNISGGNPPYAIEWSTGETTENIQDLSAGNYFVTVTDTSNCMITESIKIIEPEAIQVDFEIVNSSCGNTDGSLTATVSGGTVPYTYLWDIDSTSAHISNLLAGNYTLSVEDKNHCKAIFSTGFSDEGAPMVMIDSIHSAGCGEQGGIFVSVNGGSGSYNYEWSNGAITQDIDGFAPGEYWLKVSDGSCTNILNTQIPYIYPKKQSICMVTVDTATATNLIVWDRGNDQYVDHYNIYREGYTPDEYLLIESVDADDITEYNDTVASPYKRSWRYKISAVDACNNETELSDNHKTIHLNMNAGLGGSYNLIWDDYEGFDYNIFYIYRKQASVWALIDSMPANLHSYTDTPPSTEGLWYIVTIHTKEACMSTSRDSRASGGPYYQSTSNLEDDGIANTGDEPSSIQSLYQDIQIYPNPTRGQVIVQAKDIVRIEVITANGQKVRDIQSRNKEKMSINLKKESKGLYFVKVTTKQAVVMQKIVLE